MSKSRKVLEEINIVSSLIRGFRSLQHSVATYEQTEKILSDFYPIRKVQQDGIHICLLDIQL